LEQRIKYCSGHGGRRIAYAVAGAGPPLVCPAWWVSHVEHDWERPRARGYFAALASRHTLVRYDRVGAGLSDRERDDFTLDAELADLDAVVRHLRLERFALLGQSCGAPTGIAYAARHPDAVTHLVLYGGYVNGGALASPDVKAALMALVRASWGVGAKALADIFAPGISVEEANDLAAAQRVSATAEMAARLLQLTYDLDARRDAPKVRCPTVVLHRTRDRAIRFEAGRQAAADIPSAELVPLDGDAHIPWYGDARTTAGAALRFLGGASPGVAPDDGAAFLRRGDVWEIAYAGRTVHVKDSKGLRDLAVLLASPGEEVDAARLASGGEPDARSGADPVLDRTALEDCRSRLAEIDRLVEEAEANHDAGRAGALGAERDAILQEVRAATGLGGRPRRLGDAAERARKAVSGRIHQAIAGLRAVHPELADHLARSVATGLRCGYAPRPPLTWRT
jgi:pimeloyl-ACP methyl ester carboxylesterase